jgi:hypothetical protein
VERVLVLVPKSVPTTYLKKYEVVKWLRGEQGKKHRDILSLNVKPTERRVKDIGEMTTVIRNHPDQVSQVLLYLCSNIKRE